MSAPNIVTSRLVLRSWRDSDFEPCAKLEADPRVIEYLPWPGPSPRDLTYRAIERARSGLAENQYGWWAVEAPNVADFIGGVGLGVHTFESDFTPCMEIGWRLAYEYWGKGYATEAASAVLAYAFETLHVDEIVSLSNVRNRRSFAVMERIGLLYERDIQWPLLPAGHPLRAYALYKLRREDWSRSKAALISNR